MDLVKHFGYDHFRFHRLRSLEGRKVARHRGHLPSTVVSLVFADGVDYTVGVDYYTVFVHPYGCEE